MDNQKIMLSGIQPTGVYTLGNYTGAVKNWARLQDEFKNFYFLADLHSLTVRQDPEVLRSRIYTAYALLLACGVDPDKSVIFCQSQVPTHAEMGWVMDCYVQFGELSRMTQFKDKSQQHADNINAGLFTYPALMAGDILLYQADFVPVGEDQRQHLEITRDIAARFNGIYGPTFKIPEPYIQKAGAKIMSLQDPTKKMSKSDPNPKATVTILDSEEDILKKFKKAVTDSEGCVRYAEGKDGINNLMTIYSVFTGKSYEDIEGEFSGAGYGTFKQAVGQTVADGLKPIRDEFNRLISDKAYLEALMKKGAEAAYEVSSVTMNDVKKKLGFIL